MAAMLCGWADNRRSGVTHSVVQSLADSVVCLEDAHVTHAPEKYATLNNKARPELYVAASLRQTSSLWFKGSTAKIRTSSLPSPLPGLF